MAGEQEDLFAATRYVRRATASLETAEQHLRNWGPLTLKAVRVDEIRAELEELFGEFVEDML